MANDIFGYNAKYQGIGLITAKNMILTVNSNTTAKTTGEYLVQNVSINYQQPIRLIRELSTGNAYYLAQPPQGSMSVERIIGKTPISILLGTPGTGIWKAPEGTDDTGSGRTASLAPRSGKGVAGGKYIMNGCIVENFTQNTDINSSLVQESVVIRFGQLSEGT